MSNAKSQISKESPISTAASQKTMSLEEARAVMWLKNYGRPIGELLDEGYINQDRLEWAAKNAYNPQIKQAATVILASMRQAASTPSKSPAPKAETLQLPPFEAGVTIEQARATLWPFKDFKGQPMGMLVDTKQLTLKDLGFAIDNAWDERVRRAASVLMAARLNQVVKEPPPPAGPLKVLSAGRSYAQRRESLLTLIAGIIWGITLTLLVVAFIYNLFRTRPVQPSPQISLPAFLIALVMVIAIMGGGAWLFGYLLNWASDRLWNQIDNYRKGQEGEDHIVEAMRQHLDGNWTLFRNMTLPGRNKGDIDAVLVGPPGVWALEIKTFSGEYRNIGEQWEYRAGKKWKLYKPSPSRQANDNARRFANFLRAGGIKQWIEPVVVWANRTSPLSVNNPSVAVWTLDHLPEQLGNIWQHKTMAESDRTRIIDKLTKLCQQPEEAD
jgi:hypothetical protein